MTDKANPYSPPETTTPHHSLWSRIASVFFARIGLRPQIVPPNLVKGEAIIYGGIAFFVDPNDPNTLYAGSPSSDQSDEGFSLVAHEAVKYLPKFFADHRGLTPALGDRRFVVRIVNDYGGIFSDYTRAVQMFPAPLSTAVKNSQPEDGGRPWDAFCESL